VEGSSSLAGRRSHCDASKGANSIARQKYQSEPPASFPALGDEGDCRQPHQAPFGFPGVARKKQQTDNGEAGGPQSPLPQHIVHRWHRRRSSYEGDLPGTADAHA